MKLDPSLVAIGVSLLIVAGGFGIGHLTTVLPPTSLWVAFAIVGSLTTLSAWLGIAFLIPRLQSYHVQREAEILDAISSAIKDMEIKFGAFENRMDVFQVFQDPDWVITTKDLVGRERGLPKKEVWIVSSYLGAELDENLFAPVIDGNTSRGVTYRYVIPNDHQVRSRIKAIKEMVSHPERVIAIQIEDQDLFQLLSTHDTCVFDPFERGAGAATGYMNIPNEVNKLDYFIKLGPDYCQRLIATVQAIGHEVTLA